MPWFDEITVETLEMKLNNLYSRFSFISPSAITYKEIVISFRFPSRIIAVLTLSMLPVLCTATSVWSEDAVTKKDLSPAAANAELLGMNAKGYSLTGVEPNSDGSKVKFTLKFEKNGVKGLFHFSANHQKLGQILTQTRQRGGVIVTQLKGYKLNNNVYFAVLTKITGPAGSKANYNSFHDIPAAKFTQLVQVEKQKGGKLVDHSTYKAPNGKTYHTAVFHPK
jgi:hypothetical protein